MHPLSFNEFKKVFLKKRRFPAYGQATVLLDEVSRRFKRAIRFLQGKLPH